ncbi:MAG: DUF1684 domain-containing protein [Casimicrobiaceae bacterium]
MSAPANPFTLAGWRRIVASHYLAVREASVVPEIQAARFRDVREELFRQHPESPIAPERRAAWGGLAWYGYDPAWRVVGTIEPNAARTTFEISLATDGMLRCTRVGRIHFSVATHKAALAVYWLEGYGGGLWLPFADATSGGATYGGGRYLYDTIKGADLGAGEREIVLDFNYAYNPSCAYDERWSCPLSPPENRLPFAVPAGERAA